MNSYDTLFKQLPTYFHPVIEFREILKAHGYAVDGFETSMYQVAANNYIQTCDVITLQFWEELLEITVQPGDSLELRRRRVLQKLSLTVPFSIGFLHDMLTNMFGPDGYVLAVDPVASKIYIKLTTDDYGALAFLYDMLWDVIPAHLEIDAEQEAVNYVDSELYMGGITQSICEQTVYYENVYDNPYGIVMGGYLIGTRITTI